MRLYIKDNIEWRLFAMKPVHLPVEDVIDLHTFRPGDVPDLLQEYFRTCTEAGIFSIRVIHGKGTGVLRKRVHAALEADVRVKSYSDAPPESGGWGATLVELEKKN